MSADQESEAAQAKLIEEMVNARETMEKSTNSEMQQMFLADRAHKVVKAKAVVQGSSLTPVCSVEEV